MRRWILATALLTALGWLSPARATQYQVDPDHTNVGFQVRHLFSRVNGRFDKFDGTITYDPAHPEQAKAGPVTFQVSNKSESLVHEFIVVKTDLSLDALPYNREENEIKEDGLSSLGEVEDLNPGESGTLTLNMAPGKYVLLCNKAGHFKAGMAHPFTVMP